MLRYLANRLAQSLFTLFVISVVVVMIVHAIPGGPAQAILGQTASEEGIQEIEEQLGLNEPFHVQYVNYYSDIIFNGDFGESLVSGAEVEELIADNLSVTLMLAFGGLGFAVLIGIPFGLISGIKRNTPVDEFLTTLSFIGLSVPSFVWGIIFILVFSLHLGWLPSYGYIPLTEDFRDGIRHLIMPVICIGIVYSAVILRYVRVEVMENINKPYMVALESKGLPPYEVYFQLIRNSLIPAVTVIGLTVGSLISAAVVVEIVFAIPGSGKVLLNAIINRDYPVLQGFVLVIAVTYMTANLLVDILYTYLDPRIQY